MPSANMADAIGAACCVNVVGTPYGPRWDGGYRDNFSSKLWGMAVGMIRQVIDAARPRHTKFCIECMPWMIPSSPDECLRLIEDVDRAEFGTHLDVVNMITTPRRYFYNDEFLEELYLPASGVCLWRRPTGYQAICQAGFCRECQHAHDHRAPHFRRGVCGEREVCAGITSLEEWRTLRHRRTTAAQCSL